MYDITVISIVVAGIIGLVKDNGGIDFILSGIKRHVRTPRGAQLGIAALSALVDIATANNTIAIVMAGPDRQGYCRRICGAAQTHRGAAGYFYIGLSGIDPVWRTAAVCKRRSRGGGIDADAARAAALPVLSGADGHHRPGGDSLRRPKGEKARRRASGIDHEIRKRHRERLCRKPAFPVSFSARCLSGNNHASANSRSINV